MRSKKAFLNLITNIVREIANVVCGFVLPYILISSFGSEVYGLTESITNFLGFIVLLEAGFGPVVKVMLYKALAKKDNRQVEKILKTSERFFRKISAVFLIYVLGLAFLYPTISNLGFDYIFTATLVLVMAISVFAEYFFGITYRLLLQSDQKTYITNIIQIATMLINLCLVFIAIKCGANIIVVKIITSFVYILRPVLQNIYVRKRYKISLKHVPANCKIEQKWDAFTHHIAFMVHSKTDIVVLTLMSSLKNVAIYSVYALVLNGVKSIVGVMADSFSAAFGDMIAKSEKEILRKRFNSYETMFLTISTIVYSGTLILIVPFVTVYTLKINDADYVQPLFGALLTIGMYLLTVRQPYNELVKAAGDFKQTRAGSIVEAVVNIVLSVIMVWQFGLIGVAIGTLVAMLIRTAEFIWYVNKYILMRNVWITVKKILILIVETIVIIIISQHIFAPEMNSYLHWIIYAICIVAISATITLPVNYLLYKDDFRELCKMFKKVLKK